MIDKIILLCAHVEQYSNQLLIFSLIVLSAFNDSKDSNLYKIHVFTCNRTRHI